jgi:hypothetical protein
VCASLIFIIIPIAVGFFMLRKKPDAGFGDGQIPPAA